MSVELVRLSNHLILCCPLLLLPSIINNKNFKIEKIIKKKKEIATQFCKRVHGTKKIRCRSLPCTQAGLVFHRTPEPQSEALKEHPGNSLVVQWLRLDTLTDRSGSMPGQGTKIPQALRHGKKKQKQKQPTKKKPPVQLQRHFELPRSYIRSFLVGHGETLEGDLHILFPIFTLFIYSL